LLISIPKKANMQCRLNLTDLEPETRQFYQHALRLLADAEIPHLVCGAFALQAYTGDGRHTKDLDVFVRPGDRDRALDTLTKAGYPTRVVFNHWLAKAYHNDDFIDIIYSSGNALCPVDDSWFAHAVDNIVLDVPAKLCAPEEMIWQKSFIMERERFDGADIAHLLRIFARDLDWTRLLKRFGQHWHVLLAHLILFSYIYPSERAQLPRPIMQELLARWQTELSDASAAVEALCQGTLLSRSQYLIDVEHWGYRDARVQPYGNMSRDEIREWTAAIGKQDR
jgi:hypothetical protein